MCNVVTLYNIIQNQAVLPCANRLPALVPSPALEKKIVYHEGKNLARLGLPKGAQNVSAWCPIKPESLLIQTAVLAGAFAAAAGLYATLSGSR